MEQIKKFFRKAIEQRFWIMIVTAILMSGVAWYMTQSSLNKLYTDQETLIKTKYSDLERVKSALPTHPNQSSKTEMDRIIGNLSKDVQNAWEEQYKRQAEYMRWPDIGLTRLVNKLKEYYPVELHPKLNYPDEPADITEGEKTDFSKYFDEQMPKLAEIIGVTWVGSSAGPGAGGMGIGGMGGPSGPGLGGFDDGSSGGRGDDAGMDSSGGGLGMGGPGGFGGPGGITGRRTAPRDVVIWSKASQDELLNSIRLWQGTKPTVYQMIYTQENIWILEGLLNIIAKTNIVPQTQKPASANVQATVKQIEFIRIGAGAIGDAGDVMFGTPQAGAGTGGFEMGSGSGDSSGMGSDDSGSGAIGSDSGDDGMGIGGMGRDDGFGSGGIGMDGAGYPGGPSRSIDPANRRYVDASFQPISGDDFRTKIKSESPEDAYFAVAKRVPVRLRLTLDMRRFQDFLANCGNEGMMLEVRQVRIGNTTPAGMSGMSGAFGGGLAGAPGRGAGGFGGRGDSGPGDMGMDDLGGDSRGDGGMGMDDSGGGGMGLGMGPGGIGMGSGGLSGLRPSRRASNEMKIEVYGTVYLFYPVNIDRLGLNKVDENFTLQDSVEAPADAAPLTPESTDNAASGATPPDANADGAPSGGASGAPNANSGGAPGTSSNGAPNADSGTEAGGNAGSNGSQTESSNTSGQTDSASPPVSSPDPPGNGGNGETTGNG